MKNCKISLLVLALSIVLMNCSTSKKGVSEYIPVENKVSYETDIKPIIAASCAPCHFPPQGRKEPLENYIHVKENIGSILKLVKLPKEDRNFMPPANKKPALTKDQIALLEKWQQQNMPE